MKKIYLLLPFILILIGVIGMVTTLFLNDKKESSLLFSDISGFAVDSKENIYIGLGLYGKIQVYNKKGNFSHTWKTDCNQSFLELTKEENILVTSEKCDEQYTYNSFGKLLNRVSISDSFNSSQNNWNIFTTNQGEIYNISNTYNIIQSYPEKKLIVSQSLLIKIFKCTFIYWLTTLVGIILGLNYANKKGLLGKSAILLYKSVYRDLQEY